MINYNPKHQIKVGGKMSTEAADKAGLKLANSAFILSICVGLSALIFAVGYFLK
ncbi:hypothetical protein [Lonepinella sp. BR2930]|uniref:hypothetical protein n=1 Tax=Lonepinella sp. BR2930 TaxID=3434554 RepID=UPI003F6DBF26